MARPLTLPLLVAMTLKKKGFFCDFPYHTIDNMVSSCVQPEIRARLRILLSHNGFIELLFRTIALYGNTTGVCD